MSWKVAHYNSLRQEVDWLRAKYQELQRRDQPEERAVARCRELSRVKSSGVRAEAEAGNFERCGQPPRLTPPSVNRSATYNFLQTSTISALYHNYPEQYQTPRPAQLVASGGALRSSFWRTHGPFSGKAHPHRRRPGSGPWEHQCTAAADGIVVHADWKAGYGRLIIHHHGNGVQTYLRPTSTFGVVPGEEVRAGRCDWRLWRQSVSCYVTASHHEVRMGGTPVNPVSVHGQVSRGGRGARSKRPAVRFRPQSAKWFALGDDDGVFVCAERLPIGGANGPAVALQNAPPASQQQ